MTDVMDRPVVPAPLPGPKKPNPSWTRTNLWNLAVVIVLVLGLFGTLLYTRHTINVKNTQLEQASVGLRAPQQCIDEINGAAVGANFSLACTSGVSVSPIAARKELRLDQLRANRQYVLKRGDRLAKVRIIAAYPDSALIDFWSGRVGEVSMEQTLSSYQLGLDRYGDGNGLFPLSVLR